MSYFFEEVFYSIVTILLLVIGVVLFVLFAVLLVLGGQCVSELSSFWKILLGLLPLICFIIYSLISPIVIDRRVRRYISLYAIMLEHKLLQGSDTGCGAFYHRYRSGIESIALTFWDKADSLSRNNVIRGQTVQLKAIDCLFEGVYRTHRSLVKEELDEYKKLEKELIELRNEAMNKESFVNSFRKVMKKYSIQEYQLHE